MLVQMAGFFTRSLSGSICILVLPMDFGVGTQPTIHGGGHTSRMKVILNFSIFTSKPVPLKIRDGEDLI
jgi:hypothetical protein